MRLLESGHGPTVNDNNDDYQIMGALVGSVVNTEIIGFRHGQDFSKGIFFFF